MKSNATPEPKLTAKQEQAIIALVSSTTMEDAAKVAGVSDVTLWRWLKTEAFKSAYMEARREVVTQAIARLQHSCGAAVETLRTIAEDASAPASSRVAAARAILDTSIKSVELEDLAARLEVLEQLAACDKTGSNPRWH
jgi:AcrR family transcriptional regulator